MGGKVKRDLKDKFSKDKKIILNFFNEAVKTYKTIPKVLGWGSRDSQESRFRVLSEIGDLNRKTVLDVGCGLGDLYEFLVRKKNLNLKRYAGIDINPLMIKKAKENFTQAEFQIMDLLKNPIQGRFDYVLASGLFGLKLPHWKDFTYMMLYHMYNISNIGIGINFLSCYSPFNKNSKCYYACPSKILSFICDNLSRRVVLRQDYKANDFTVYIYKDIYK